MRMVVFCPNLIGDAVMATPALRALREHFREARIVGVMKPAIERTLAGGPWFDGVILTDPRSGDSRKRFWGVVSELRAEKLELAVLFPNSVRSALMARVSGIRRVAGYARGGRGVLLSDRLFPPRDEGGRLIPVPIVGYYLELTRLLGCVPGSSRLELYTEREDEEGADAVWKKHGLDGPEPVVCLNTGGAFGPAKNWPLSSFADLARRLAEERGCRVLVICGPAERENALAICERAAHPGVCSLASERLSIGLSKACVRRADLLVTTDSGPRHFATAFGVASVSLFGPTHIGWTRTHHPRGVHLQVPVPCGPCQRPTCSEGHHRCMTELSTEEVFGACLRLLGPPRRATVGREGPAAMRPHQVGGSQAAAETTM